MDAGIQLENKFPWVDMFKYLIQQLGYFTACDYICEEGAQSENKDVKM